jgi:hypothetical protein
MTPQTSKEMTMQYKTITLRLLEQRPKLYEQLRRMDLLLPTLDTYAQDLKMRQQAWQEALAPKRPGSDPGQIAGEALELALQELKEVLPSESTPDESEPLSLDAAIAFLRRRTPPA